MNQKVEKYLNPLTVDAKIFLDAIKTSAKSENKIDVQLVELLYCIVDEIDSLLSRKLIPVEETKSKKLVPLNAIDDMVRIFHCTRCKTDVGKSVDKVATHLMVKHNNKFVFENIKDKPKKIVNNLPEKAATFVRQETTNFFKDAIQIAEKLKTIPEYLKVENDLMELLPTLFPDNSIKVYKFGSRISGIGNRNSDLDIFIDIDNSFHTFENRASPEKVQILKRVSNAMKRNSNKWKCLVIIEHARVPIIRVINHETSIQCDIGFSNSLGVCNTLLVEYLFELQPIARRMCIYLKKWIEYSRLEQHISTYSIILMVIYFMQIHIHLPAIKDLQENLTVKVNIGPWIANFNKKSLNEMNMTKLGVDNTRCRKFIQSFFTYYADFHFDQNVVCPYLGHEISKTDIENLMPKGYKVFTGAQQNSKDRILNLQLNKRMVVQDPIQLNHNVTKSISKVWASTIQLYFRQSAQTLSNS